MNPDNLIKAIKNSSSPIETMEEYRKAGQAFDTGDITQEQFVSIHTAVSHLLVEALQSEEYLQSIGLVNPNKEVKQ